MKIGIMTQDSNAKEPAGSPQWGPESAIFPGSWFSVAEVFQFIAFCRKTGTIRVWLPTETISIDIRKGNIVDVLSDDGPPGSRLGEILVEQGAVSARDLDLYRRKRSKSKKRLGRGLRSVGLINRKALCLALRRQLELAIARCLEAEIATVELMPLRNRYGSLDLWLDLNAVLLEVTANSDGQRRDSRTEEPSRTGPRKDALPSQREAEESVDSTVHSVV